MDLKIDENLAELVGIILGDGSLNIYRSDKYSTYYRLKITLDSRETDYIDYVSSLISTVLNTSPIIKKRKNEHTTDILVFKKDIVLKLTSLGLTTSPKWNRASIPSNFLKPHLIKLVIRGYFDTDGCVTMTNNNGSLYPRLEMKIQPSPMQKQFVDAIKKLGFKANFYNIGKEKIRVQINGKKQLNKWMKEIGLSNKRHLVKIKELEKKKKKVRLRLVQLLLLRILCVVFAIESLGLCIGRLCQI